MASIRKEILVNAAPAYCWEVLRDVGALHTRLAVGFVTDVRMEPGARVVTFANGVVARELIVAVDDAARRVAWAVVGGAMTHHNASAQVFADGENRTRFVWIADLLPDDMAPGVAAMMDQGLAAITRTLESGPP
jgi:hypothetical protein